MAALLSTIGWTFLPGTVTAFVHNQLCSLLSSRIAQPGSYNYARDRRIIYTGVVLSYLIYTLIAAYLAIEPNYYEILGVSIHATDKELRKSYRKLSAVAHPDKGGSETAFRLIRTAYDTLNDPTKRKAYNRFGSQILSWTTAVLPIEYMFMGLQAAAPFYVGAFLFMFVLSWINKATYGAYWRACAMISLAIIHFNICIRSDRPQLLSLILPGKVQFEYVSLLQSLTVTMMIAINQVGPVLFPSTVPMDEQELVKEIYVLSSIIQSEAVQALQIVHTPFARGTTKTAELYKATANWLERQRIAQDPAVQQAFKAARDRHSST